jgi:hypothetical protein
MSALSTVLRQLVKMDGLQGEAMGPFVTRHLPFVTPNRVPGRA